MSVVGSGSMIIGLKGTSGHHLEGGDLHRWFRPSALSADATDMRNQPFANQWGSRRDPRRSQSRNVQLDGQRELEDSAPRRIGAGP